MPVAYLLDLYDTLVYADWNAWWRTLQRVTGASQDALGAAYAETRKQRNEGRYETPEEEIGAILTSAGLSGSDSAVAQAVLEAEASFGEEIRLFDDTLPTLAALRAAGIRTALVSNCNRGTREIVQRLGIADAVDELVLSCEIGSSKPDAGIYRTALDAVDVEAADAVFVDDQTAYCDGARAVGIDTRLIVRSDAHPAEGFAPSTNGHTVIADLTALL